MRLPFRDRVIPKILSEIVALGFVLFIIPAIYGNIIYNYVTDYIYHNYLVTHCYLQYLSSQLCCLHFMMDSGSICTVLLEPLLCLI